MSEQLQDLFFIFTQMDGYKDTNERENARACAKEAIGENYDGDIEDAVETYALCSEKQGFMYGFRYAAALLADGKAVGA